MPISQRGSSHPANESKCFCHWPSYSNFASVLMGLTEFQMLCRDIVSVQVAHDYGDDALRLLLDFELSHASGGFYYSRKRSTGKQVHPFYWHAFQACRYASIWAFQYHVNFFAWADLLQAGHRFSFAEKYEARPVVRSVLGSAPHREFSKLATRLFLVLTFPFTFSQCFFNVSDQSRRTSR